MKLSTMVRDAGAVAIRHGRRALSFLLRSRRRTVLLCGTLGFVLAAAGGSRPPAVHDEFSYLLAGETFASGRLTNPAHPMWRHFESFHVIQQPTYSSKYPPAQGLALALGIRIAGSPAVGVWISIAIMVAALTWMLQAWVPPRWALWGGVAVSLWVVSLHANGGYWATSFWGGSMAALGGALLLGGVRRLARKATSGASLAVGVGLAVLASSRPFEGLFFSVVPMVVVGVVLLGQFRRRAWRAIATTVAPMGAVLVTAGVMMATHNEAVTNSVTEFPYQRYSRTYESVPVIIGLPMPALPAYNAPIMKEFYTKSLWYTNRRTTLREYVLSLPAYSSHLVRFYALLMAMPLLVLPWIIRTKWTPVVVASIATTGAAVVVSSYWWLPHYAAPAVGAMLLLFVTSARFLSQLHRRGIRHGKAFTRLVVATIAVSATIQLIEGRLRDRQAMDWPTERMRIQGELAAKGRHFVLVEYGPRHDPHAEWVYNAADIDAAPVVWGRALGASDSTFIRYFADREGWRLRIDDDHGPFQLTPITSP